ncbi:MAG TPA: hypothetical protein VHL11_11180, partial [Phototrophicaceae bacterium]|nr:hypothetical protein [Phototrophicaceae bacterium]
MTKTRFFVSVGLVMLFALALLATLPPTSAAQTLNAVLTATIRPSFTPLPSPTPTTTALPGLDLPDWLRDPDTDVVVLFTFDDRGYDNGGINFINAVTDERFSLKLPYVHEVRWIETADGVYIDLVHYQVNGTPGFDEYIDLATGKLTRFAFGDPDKPEALPAADTPPASADNGAGISYLLSAHTDMIEIDSDNHGGLYQAVTYFDLTLTDVSTGKTISLYDNQRKLSSNQRLGIQWLDNGQYLGVWFDYPDPASEAEKY